MSPESPVNADAGVLCELWAEARRALLIVETAMRTPMAAAGQTRSTVLGELQNVSTAPKEYTTAAHACLFHMDGRPGAPLLQPVVESGAAEAAVPPRNLSPYRAGQIQTTCFSAGDFAVAVTFRGSAAASLALSASGQ